MDDNNEVEYLSDNPYWSWKLMVAHAPGEWAKYAIIQLLNRFEAMEEQVEEGDEPISLGASGVIDLILQYAGSGMYLPPGTPEEDIEDSLTLDDVDNMLNNFEDLLRRRGREDGHEDT